MSLLNALKSAATKLGVIKIVTVPNADQRTRITTRSVSLKDLAKELRATLGATPPMPAEFGVPFDQVFATAKIEPLPSADGKEKWSVDALYQLVAAPPYKDLPREQAQLAVLAVLAAKKIDVKDLVKDAMARDKALDAYGTQMFQQHKDLQRTRKATKAALQEQIAALQAQLAALDAQAQTADRQWADWWQRKFAYERQMAHALSYLLRDPIVTIDSQLPVDDNPA